jgi:hypothetical protein
MAIRTISLTLGSLVLFALAFRFGSHGFRLHDNLCIGLACAAIALGVLLLVFALRGIRRPSA